MPRRCLAALKDLVQALDTILALSGVEDPDRIKTHAEALHDLNDNVRRECKVDTGITEGDIIQLYDAYDTGNVEAGFRKALELKRALQARL